MITRRKLFKWLGLSALAAPAAAVMTAEPKVRAQFQIDSRTVAEALDVPKFDQDIRDLGTRFREYSAEEERKREETMTKFLQCSSQEEMIAKRKLLLEQCENRVRAIRVKYRPLDDALKAQCGALGEHCFEASDWDIKCVDKLLGFKRSKEQIQWYLVCKHCGIPRWQVHAEATKRGASEPEPELLKGYRE